ncbi:PREDICTED: uncharacterized protein LOC108556312 [Nicrophorus vespilloides]|uniref:Uncharacterized protein LOC108556312 n=1 Tax=Nicrophorus vespilloides TaxID=110193 RepID=A0ABM1LZV7_NICVS|nr:PREDICTED: uncharacterized protein LOC108556312 [Nicrophorus vespilloides]
MSENMHSSDIFNLADAARGEANQIFSIGGSPSFRINRRAETNSSVFPSGCMGNASEETLKKRREAAMGPPPHPDQEPQMYHARGDVHGDDEEEEEKGALGEPTRSGEEEDDDDEVEKTGVRLKPTQSLSNIPRNPLTGDGIVDETKKSGKRGMRNKNAQWIW